MIDSTADTWETKPQYLFLRIESASMSINYYDSTERSEVMKMLEVARNYIINCCKVIGTKDNMSDLKK